MVTIPGVAPLREYVANTPTIREARIPTGLGRRMGLGSSAPTVDHLLNRGSNSLIGVARNSAARLSQGQGGMFTRLLNRTANGGIRVLNRLGGVRQGVPRLGGAAAAAFEIPHLWEGFSDGRGANAVVESGSRVTGAMAGAAIGSTFAPLVGTIIGGAVGYFLGDKVGDIGSSILSGLGIGRTENEQEELDQQPAGQTPQFAEQTGGPNNYHDALAALDRAAFRFGVTPGMNDPGLQQNIYRV